MIALRLTGQFCRPILNQLIRYNRRRLNDVCHNFVNVKVNQLLLRQHFRKYVDTILTFLAQQKR